MTIFILIAVPVVLFGLLVMPRMYAGIERAVAWRRVRRVWRQRRSELARSVTRRSKQ